MDFIRVIIGQFLFLVWLALLIRVILSWVIALGGGRNDAIVRFNRSIIALTEPMIAPIRRVLPPTGSFDFSVLAAFILIGFLRSAI